MDSVLSSVSQALLHTSKVFVLLSGGGTELRMPAAPSPFPKPGSTPLHSTSVQYMNQSQVSALYPNILVQILASPLTDCVNLGCVS